MKRYIIIAILLFPLFSFSQNFDGGFFCGLTSTQVDGDLWGGYNKAGVQFGGFAKFNFSNKLKGIFEISYTQKGSREVNVKTNTYYQLRLGYLQAPVLLEFKLPIKDKDISLEGGASIGYLLSAREDRDGNDFLDADPAFKKYELAYLFGANYYLNDNWHVNARFSYSIIAIRGLSNNINKFFNGGQYNNILTFAIYHTF